MIRVSFKDGSSGTVNVCGTSTYFCRVGKDKVPIILVSTDEGVFIYELDSVNTLYVDQEVR